MKLLSIIYHYIMMKYYGWQKHVACNKMRKFWKNRSCPSNYTDDQIIEGIKRYKDQDPNDIPLN